MAEDALLTTIATSGHARHFEQGAMVVMEADGAVRALVGGKDYGESRLPTAPPTPTASPALRSSLTSTSPRSKRENTRRTPS